MKVIIVGASGTIGSAVVSELEKRHEIVRVGHVNGDINVDIINPESIENMYASIGRFDALVSATGKAFFGPFDDLDKDKISIGISSKLLGQVNLVLLGQKYIADNGSFTLASGILSEDPVKGAAQLSMINGAINGFVVGTAIELPRGIRINSVSPGVVAQSMDKYAPYFRGHQPVDVKKVATAYSKSVEGLLTGKIFKVVGN